MLGKIINVELIRHPLNWIIVVLMCTLFLVFLSLVFPEAAGDG